jgi:hypothetical protein
MENETRKNISFTRPSPVWTPGPTRQALVQWNSKLTIFRFLQENFSAVTVNILEDSSVFSRYARANYIDKIPHDAT